MAAAKKPQSNFHVAKVAEAALSRIEDARKAALGDAPNYINQKFTRKRLKAIEDVSDHVGALLIAGGAITQSELEAARTQKAAAQ